MGKVLNIILSFYLTTISLQKSQWSWSFSSTLSLHLHMCLPHPAVSPITSTSSIHPPGLESSLIISIWKHSWIFSCEIKPPSKPCPRFLIKDLKRVTFSLCNLQEKAVTLTKTVVSLCVLQLKKMAKLF